MLTWKDEYTLVFGHKWTGLTWMFILNRYVLLFSAIQGIVPYTPSVSIAAAVESSAVLTVITRWTLVNTRGEHLIVATLYI